MNATRKLNGLPLSLLNKVRPVRVARITVILSRWEALVRSRDNQRWETVPRSALRNRGGRPPSTADMAVFFREREGKATHKERAAEWMRRFPDDPRTKDLPLLKVRERLREAARRHLGDKKRA